MSVFSSFKSCCQRTTGWVRDRAKSVGSSFQTAVKTTSELGIPATLYAAWASLTAKGDVEGTGEDCFEFLPLLAFSDPENCPPDMAGLIHFDSLRAGATGGLMGAYGCTLLGLTSADCFSKFCIEGGFLHKLDDSRYMRILRSFTTLPASLIKHLGGNVLFAMFYNFAQKAQNLPDLLDVIWKGLTFQLDLFKQGAGILEAMEISGIATLNTIIFPLICLSTLSNLAALIKLYREDATRVAKTDILKSVEELLEKTKKNPQQTTPEAQENAKEAFGTLLEKWQQASTADGKLTSDNYETLRNTKRDLENAPQPAQAEGVKALLNDPDQQQFLLPQDPPPPAGQKGSLNRGLVL